MEKGAVLRQLFKRDDNLLWPVLVDHVTDDMRLCWEAEATICPHY